MSFDPFAYEREEERDSERFYTGPDDPDRPDPSEYQETAGMSLGTYDRFGPDETPPAYLFVEKRLDCGHIVAASEDSGGMDELDRVTLADVERLLDFKIKSHSCERIEAQDAAGSPGIGPNGGPF